jgi:hypothetical protein
LIVAAYFNPTPSMTPSSFAVDLIWQPIDATGLMTPLAGYNVYRQRLDAGLHPIGASRQINTAAMDSYIRQVAVEEPNRRRLLMPLAWLTIALLRRSAAARKALLRSQQRLSPQLYADYRPLAKDIRALPAELAASAIEAWGICSQVSVLDIEGARQVSPSPASDAARVDAAATAPGPTGVEAGGPAVEANAVG